MSSNRYSNNMRLKSAKFIRIYFDCSVLVGLLLLALGFVIQQVSPPSAYLIFAFTLTYMIICLILQWYLDKRIAHDMIEFASDYSQVQKRMMYELSVPYALLDSDGKVLWMNEKMLETIEKTRDFNKSIYTVMPELASVDYPKEGESKEISLTYADRHYRIELKHISAKELYNARKKVGFTKEANEDVDNLRNRARKLNKRTIKRLDRAKKNIAGEAADDTNITDAADTVAVAAENANTSTGEKTGGRVTGRRASTQLVDENSFIAMYMFDETEIKNYMQKISDDRIVIALVYIDNYEEALETIDDVRRSLFIGLVDKRVNRYFIGGQPVIRKIEKDKYMIVFNHKYLERIIANKLSILEDIKGINIGNEMKLTLSIGIGTGANDYAKTYDMAKAAMDLALGRGGDQAVVKEADKITYYGGKSQQMEKNTRVKVRIKAHALRQLLMVNDDVLVMGHKMADIDAFGSALGIHVIAKHLGKNSHIVLEDIGGGIKPFVNRVREVDDTDEDDSIIYTKEQALSSVTPHTVLVIVDVNKANMTECPELIDRCKTVVVFDHHRKSNEPINKAELSYVDPYASSAAEMVAEMIQYVDEDNIKLKPCEAEAMYAGIYIDTDGFHSKSGPRTFEAAAYLRRNGADITRIRKMLRNDMSEYKAVAAAVSRAEVYKESFAITVFEGHDIESPTVAGAKAANELLDIIGIKASFVFTEFNGRIFISARSIDEVNVQLIMEKLGGGGHMTIAGAQLSGCSVAEAIEDVKDIIDNMIAEGEI